MTSWPRVGGFWARGADVEIGDPLSADSRAEIAIVGAGIVGMSSAIHLARLGRDVAVVERAHVGFGSSGRNFGVMCLPFPWTPQWITNVDIARGHVEWAQRALDEAEHGLREDGVDCELRRAPIWLASPSPEGDRALLAAAELYGRIGVACRFVQKEHVPSAFRPGGALAVDDQAMVDPFRLMRGLRRVALEAGVRLYEATEVAGVEGGSPARIVTRGGVLSADRIVVATGGAVADLTDSGSDVERRRAYGLSTAPLSADELEAVGPRDDEIFFDTYFTGNARYFRRLRPDGRLLFGAGGPNSGGALLTDEEKFHMIRQQMLHRHPALARTELEAAWSGVTCDTRTGLPIFRADTKKNVFVALVGNGRGMGLGASAGRLVGAMLGVGDPDPRTHLFLSLCS
jgi:gamma-glutamylputrescine oxidase